MGHKNTKRDAVAGLFDRELTRIRDRQVAIATETAALKAELLSLDREAERLNDLGAQVQETLIVERGTADKGAE